MFFLAIMTRVLFLLPSSLTKSNNVFSVQFSLLTELFFFMRSYLFLDF